MLQLDLHRWRQRNFPNANATQQLLGVVEEVGELAHAHLKQIQGIRGTPEEHDAAIKDAVADIVIYLLGYCSYRGLGLSSVLQQTATEVMKRDWLGNPDDGYAEDVARARAEGYDWS
jgi:NTP pyrophosphatase (non-canonical NTP hydrolase)